MTKELFNGFLDGFRKFGHCVAYVVNFVLLTIVYVLGVGLTSIGMKAAGKRFLELKLDKSAKSYWSNRKEQMKHEDYFKMF